MSGPRPWWTHRDTRCSRAFEWRDGLPCWRWRVGEVVLERRIAMRHGHPSVAVVHTLLAGGPVELTVEPLCTWRDAHGERQSGNGLRVDRTADGVVVEDAYRIAGPGFDAGRANGTAAPTIARRLGAGSPRRRICSGWGGSAGASTSARASR